MKLRILFIVVLLTCAHLLGSSNDCAGIAGSKVTGKLQATKKMQYPPVTIADDTILGISPSGMLLSDI